VKSTYEKEPLKYLSNDGSSGREMSSYNVERRRNSREEINSKWKI